mmetsp:Transcript_20739/g.60326  ORF Transcript_20739/g.60326 Transcript_20739/m.60326 type:complete len:245 (-) Transcript_20739:138-872(-)
MPDQPPLDAVFLVSESDADKVSRCDFLGFCPGDRDCSRSNEELDIAEAEGCCVGVGATPTIFSWSKQEEEGDPGEVHDGARLCGPVDVEAVKREEDSDGERVDAVRDGVFPLVSREPPRQKKVENSQRRVSGVAGPHGVEDLADGAEVLLHCPLFDPLASRSQDTRADTLGKELEKLHGVRDAGEIRQDLQSGTERSPLPPRCGVVPPTSDGNPSADRFACNAICTSRFSARVGWSSFQDEGCG